MAASQALAYVGLPEASFHLTQATIYLALAPKSNSITEAMGAARSVVADGAAPVVPAHLRDSHYQGAKELGHGDGYKYSHAFPGHVVDQKYFPDGVEEQSLFHPGEQGREAGFKERLEWLDKVFGRKR